MRVRYAECDAQGVVFNANYLMYFDVAMTELWRETIGPYEQAVAEHGADMVVAEARIRYLAPLRFDEEFELTAEVTNLGTTSMTTALTADRAGTTAAEGELRHVFIDPASGAKAPIPDAIRTALELYVPPRTPS
jgi:acyl-CoA thioester hydrolase